MTNTPELTREQKIAKYEADRKARGTTEVAARLVRTATITESKDGSKRAVFRLATYNKALKKTEFFTAGAYIAQGKADYEAFLSKLEKGQLVSVEFKKNGIYNNIYNIMDRSDADKQRKSVASPEPVTQEIPVELEF